MRTTRKRASNERKDEEDDEDRNRKVKRPRVIANTPKNNAPTRDSKGLSLLNNSRDGGQKEHPTTMILNHRQTRRVFKGTYSHAVCLIPFRLGSRLRILLYNLSLAIAYPFYYDISTDMLKLYRDIPFNTENTGVTNYFCRGSLIETNVRVVQDAEKIIGVIPIDQQYRVIRRQSRGSAEEEEGEDSAIVVAIDKELTPNSRRRRMKDRVPLIRERIGSKTSQGKVFTAVVKVDAEFVSLLERSEENHRQNETINHENKRPTVPSKHGTVRNTDKPSSHSSSSDVETSSQSGESSSSSGPKKRDVSESSSSSEDEENYRSGEKPVKMMIVVKVDRISKSTRKWWIGSDDNPVHRIRKPSGNYVTINASYMDALCSIMLSHISEFQESPHFAICYGTQAANARYVRRTEGTTSDHIIRKDEKQNRTCMDIGNNGDSPIDDTPERQGGIVGGGKGGKKIHHKKVVQKQPKHQTEKGNNTKKDGGNERKGGKNAAKSAEQQQGLRLRPLPVPDSIKRTKHDTEKNLVLGPGGATGTPSQIIWMEYLQYSMSKILKIEKDAPYWWSSLIQVWAGICLAKRRFNFVHNDLHCNNIRAREVSRDAYLYYKTSDGTLLKVPTYGYVYVIIDYGRSMISVDGEEMLMSSEFTGNGNCSDFEPNNSCIDVVRLIGSIEQDLDYIKDKRQRKELADLFSKLCETTDGTNLIDAWTKATRRNLFFYLDQLPRLKCKRYDPFAAIPLFYHKFKVDSIPADIRPFYIPLSMTAPETL